MAASALDRFRSRLRTASDSDGGFSLLEVVVSFALFAIVAAAATAAVANSIRTSDSTAQRVEATQIAQQDIEKARALKPAQISVTGYPLVVTAGARSFTVTRTINYSTGSSCPSTRVAGSEYYLNVTDVVTWSGDTTRSVRMDTVLAC